MAIERYPSVEANGLEGAKRAAARHMPGGDLYIRGNKVHIEHGQIPQWGSAIPSSPTYGKTEKGYMIIVERDN